MSADWPFTPAHVSAIATRASELERIGEETQDPEVENGEAVQVARCAQEHRGGEVVEVRAGEVERGDPDQLLAVGTRCRGEERGVRAAVGQLIRGDGENR